VGCVLLVAVGVTVALWGKIKPAITKISQEVVQGPSVEPEPGEGEEPATSAPREKSPKTGKGGGPRVKTKPRDPDEEQPTPVGETPAGAFPRRALVISVHNYLYANPIPPGPTGNDIRRVIDVLSLGLKIPQTQMAHLSDASKSPWPARPPMKPVIQKTLTDFLESSRPQDRVMVVFVGHSVESGDEGYLVPIEGELDNVQTLIPLKWVYEQMAKCPARQKVLVLDANRFNPTQGLERPASGKMGPKFEAMIKNPPPGVQVWAACSAGQESLELDERPAGMFLESIKLALLAPKNEKSALAGRIQKPTDLIPLETLQEAVNKRLQAELGPRKMTQVALLTGQDKDNGAEVDLKEQAPPRPTLVAAAVNNQNTVKDLIEEISVPPLKVGASDNFVSFSVLPAFPPEVLKKYEDKGEKELPLVKAVKSARIALWAVSTTKAPKELEADVAALRSKLGVDLSIMKEHYNAPPAGNAETAFKRGLEADLKKMSKIVEVVEEALSELKEVEGEKDTAPRRWQANYVFMRARVEEQLAFLEEYEGQLGQMRKEFPERDPAIHGGWRLAAKEKASDSAGKKYDKSARKLLTELAKEHAGTPWEVLAKREKMTALGLEWQPAK